MRLAMEVEHAELPGIYRPASAMTGAELEARSARLRIRLMGRDDAPLLLQYKVAHHAFFKPWWPRQDLSQYTLGGQARHVQDLLRDIREDRRYPFLVFVEGAPDLAGRINLNNVVRGAFESADLGYDLAPQWHGQGFMTEAVGLLIPLAFGPLGLHRVQAAVMPSNLASRRVLEKNRFQTIGLAPRYLAIDGVYRDHLLYQRLLDD
jgi:ribosomal-protein-alanine N-acetyltransferase